MISVILPVYKEQKRIVSVLEDLRTLDSQHLLQEILVVRTVGDIYPLPTLMSPERGRAAQMNYGASLATGDILVFVHCDTRLPASALEVIAEKQCGAFSLRFDSPALAYRALAAITTWRSKLLHLPYGDQVLFLPRVLFENIGGFANVPILEDVLLAERIRPEVVRECVVTSTRKYQKYGFWRTLLLHRAIMFGYMAGVGIPHLARLQRRFLAQPLNQNSDCL